MTQQAVFGARSTADEVLAGKDLTGKTIIVTGANTGIGFEAARAFSAAGGHVIFACRSESRGRDAVARVQAQHPDASAVFMPLDLGSAASIIAFCDALPAQTIDILVCNAGLVASQYQETAQGIESTVGISHFGHFLLVQRLMPRLLAAGTPRVVMLSSESHRMPPKLNFDQFPLKPDDFKMMLAYGQAKLCNVLMANELQRRYGTAGLTACAVHPGNLVTTEIGRQSALMRVLMTLISPFTKNPNQGASTTVFCAVHEPASEIQGKYFSHCRDVASTPEANNASVAARLWEMSENWCKECMLGLDLPAK